MLSFGRVRALIANRNEIGASRRADYIFFSYGLTIHSQKLPNGAAFRATGQNWDLRGMRRFCLGRQVVRP